MDRSVLDRVRTIAVIGNGAVDRRYAATIESHDLIIRFNDCRNFEECATRTDVVAVCNIGRAAKKLLSSPDWRNRPCVLEASQIWSTRDPLILPAMKRRLAESHPDLYDLCDDHTNDFGLFCAQTKKQHVVIPQSSYEAVFEELTAYWSGSYVTPSSGVIAISGALARFPNATITLAGFGHEGWEGHPFSAEKLLVDIWCQTTRVRRLENP
ncbi:glycosyltransferase family 29 protein [Rhizobium sp. ZPR3]|uniref:Glycosyltransferase family 29 protein n=2 Tax=unclassified Rhizobium TaxID=2613769 RepID=A0AAU7SRR4_9HYPH